MICTVTAISNATAVSSVTAVSTITAVSTALTISPIIIVDNTLIGLEYIYEGHTLICPYIIKGIMTYCY